MELLETQDPEKKKLVETSERHKRELEKEVGAIAEKSERILTNALVIGGTLALTYLIVSQISKKSKAKKRKKAAAEGGAPVSPAEEVESHEPNLLSQIGTKVLNQATLLLLDIARQKLTEYLQNRKAEK